MGSTKGRHYTERLIKRGILFQQLKHPRGGSSRSEDGLLRHQLMLESGRVKVDLCDRVFKATGPLAPQ
jgi:hypothetical protein